MAVVSEKLHDADRRDRPFRCGQRGHRGLSRPARQRNLTAPDGNYHDLPEFLVAGTPASCSSQGGRHRGIRRIHAAPIGVESFGSSRRLLYLSYNAERDGGEQREAHYTEFKAWLQAQYARYNRTDTFFR